MLKEFMDHISQNRLFYPTDKILLAVSGGADSVVMAHLFYRAGFSFAIAHCNFQLRGAESDGDELFCRDLAVCLGVRFFSQTFHTQEKATEKGISVQMAARELRYNWFSGLKDQHGFRFIATAHHQDDQVETILINIARGTGIDGLKGIPVVANTIIRPLWWFTATHIRQFARQEGIVYREDSSNLESKYIRNKIRHHIVPLFKEINPSFSETVVKLSRVAGKMSDTFHVLLDEVFKKHIQDDGKQIFIHIGALTRYSSPELIIYELLKKFNFTASIAQQIADALTQQPGKVFYSPTHQCVKDRRYLIVAPINDDATNKKQFDLVSPSASLLLPNGTIVLEELSEILSEGISHDASVAFLDKEKVSFPLLLRHPRPGDFFIPFGMSGKKKISDYLTDKKIPVHEKEKVWLLCNKDDIIWVVGFRPDNRYRVSDKTRTILKVKFQEHFK